MHIPFFHQNNSPLEQAKLDEEGNPVENEQAKPNNSKKIIIIAAVGVLLILIGILLLIPSQNLPFVQKPSPKVIAKVGSKTLTETDLNNAFQLQWGVYASRYKKDKKLQAETLANLIEETIVQQQATKMKISVSPIEIYQKEQELIQQAGGISTYNSILKGNGWTTQDQRKKIKYNLLKEKVTTKIIAWRLVNYVGSSQNVAAPNYAAKTVEATTNMTKAQQYLKEGKSAREAASLVTNNFKNFFNIYYSDNVKITKFSKINKIFIDGIFQYHIGETTPVIGSGTQAMMTAQILEENNTPYNSYEEWLKAMKKKYKI